MSELTPTPWVADTAQGTPRPSRWKSATASVRVGCVALVDDQGDGFAQSAQPLGDLDVLGGAAVPCIDHEEQVIGLLDGALDLTLHQRLDALGRGADTARVDDHIGSGSDPSDAILTIAGQPWKVSDQCVAGAGEPVEERRFADIGAAEQGDDGQHAVQRGFLVSVPDPEGAGSSGAEAAPASSPLAPAGVLIGGDAPDRQGGRGCRPRR